MTGFPVCGTVMEFMKFVWRREGCFLLEGRDLIARPCSSRRVKSKTAVPGHNKMARTERASSDQPCIRRAWDSGLRSPSLSLDPGGQRVCDRPFPLSGLATSCCLFCLFAFPSLSVAPRRLLSDTTAPILVFCLRDCPLPNPLTHITAASPRWQALFCSPVPWWVPIAPRWAQTQGVLHVLIPVVTFLFLTLAFRVSLLSALSKKPSLMKPH